VPINVCRAELTVQLAKMDRHCLAEKNVGETKSIKQIIAENLQIGKNQERDVRFMICISNYGHKILWHIFILYARLDDDGDAQA
jgi:hypothetical protein